MTVNVRLLHSKGFSAGGKSEMSDISWKSRPFQRISTFVSVRVHNFEIHETQDC